MLPLPGPAPRAALLALLLLPAALAGCTAPAPPQDAAEPLQGTGQPEAPANATSPRPDEREGNFTAFEETNATQEGSFGQPHGHDYWAGRDRVELFALPARMDAQLDQDDMAWVVVGVPSPAVVWEGTGAVELTITNPRRHVCEPLFTSGPEGGWTCLDPPAANADPGLAVPLELSYQHASASEWLPAGTLAWGQPLAIPLQAAHEGDMPHSATSLWRFRLRSPEPRDLTLGFDVAAALLRGGSVGVWPGHPDFYRDGHERVVLDAAGATRRGVPVVDGPMGRGDALVPDKLVSWGTRTLRVELTIEGVEAALPPTHYRLGWHNASGAWNSTDPWDARFAAGNETYTWTLFADDAGMDSPYAERSRWGFVVYGAHTTAALSCISGCFPYELAYRLRIVASDVPAEAYDSW